MTDLAETIALLRKLYVSGRGGYVDDICRMEREIWKVLPALLDAAEAGMRARRTALEDAKAALKDLWFGDEVARPGSLDAIEAIDALIAAAPTIEQSSKVATCNDSLQVPAARDAALEEAAQIADAEAAKDLEFDGDDARRDAAEEIAFAIRALKGAA